MKFSLLFSSTTFAIISNLSTTTASFTKMSKQFDNYLTESESNTPAGLRSLSIVLGSHFERIQEYGCWCFFDDKHGRGKSVPVDELDNLCMVLAEGYDCAVMDDTTGDCVPWEVEYVGGPIGSSIVGDCEEKNEGNIGNIDKIIQSVFNNLIVIETALLRLLNELI